MIFECQEFIETYGGDKDKIASPQVITGICLANSSFTAEPQNHGDFQLVPPCIDRLGSIILLVSILERQHQPQSGKLKSDVVLKFSVILCLGTSKSLTVPGDHKPRKLSKQM